MYQNPLQGIPLVELHWYNRPEAEIQIFSLLPPHLFSSGVLLLPPATRRPLGTAMQAFGPTETNGFESAKLDNF